VSIILLMRKTRIGGDYGLTRTIEWPLIKKNAIEFREYQVNLSKKSSEKSTLVVLSTGLGKTIIAALVAAQRLDKNPESKVVFLAPSRPLVDQQARFLRRVMDLDENLIVCLTGQDGPTKRRELWAEARVVVMTPQSLQNDLIQRSYSLSDVSLMVYDEAHRGVGDYAYTFIAELYEKQGKNQISLGLTASPGHEAEHIKKVCTNLRLSQVEVRTEKSSDVRKYIVSIESDVRYIQLPPEVEVLRDILFSLLEDYISPITDYGYSIPKSSRRLSKRDVLRLQGEVRREIGSQTQPSPKLFMLIRNLTAALRVLHLLEFIGTQGLTPTYRYVQGMYEEVRNKKSSKGVKDLVSRPRFSQFENLLHALISKGYRHPKVDAITELVSEQISVNLDSRILVFTRFRDTAVEVVEMLEQLEDVRVSRFVGQSSKGSDKGFSQKKQVEVLDGFRNNEFNVLVATQVGEEGLDIPECNLVVFYDCVPSVVPYIQRRGRTGRRSAGKVVIFVAKGTHDEFYHWSVIKKLKKMPAALKEAEEEQDELQTSLEEFEEEVTETEDLSERHLPKAPTPEEGKVKLIVDSRELPTAVARELTRLDIEISSESLEIGDYIASYDVAIERKESNDFLQSLIDGRLFVQLSALKSAYRRPVLIIEGEKLIGLRGINPASIYGALASIAIRIQVPIIWTHSAEETANVLYRIAHLEQIGSKKTLRTRTGDTKGSDADAMEYILSGFPGIDTVTSRSILADFGTLEDVFSADEKDLQKVKGVGPKIAGRIKRLLTTVYPQFKLGKKEVP